jgi:hypothetical protein
MADIPKEALPRELAKEDYCPKCLGELDTGWECNECGYDASHLINDKQPAPQEARPREPSSTE